MKRIAWIISLCLVFAVVACETENKKYYAQDFTSPEIIVPTGGSHITLTENAAADSLQFSWEPANYGFPAAATYTLQVAKAGTFFDPAIKIAETKQNHTGVSYATLNNSILIAGLVPETPAEVEFRVVTSINSYIQTLRSEPITLTVVAYNVSVNYPVVYVPGSYQGWNPGDTTTILTSPKANQVYEGYLWFTPQTFFKIVNKPSWGAPEWGYASPGKIKEGGDNIPVNNTTAGLYKLTADLNALTYSALPVTWTITGSSTNNTPLLLTYNQTDGILAATATLSAGDLFFKETGAGNRILGQYFGQQLTDNGTGIPVPAAGIYTIILNLQKYPYTFQLKTAE